MFCYDNPIVISRLLVLDVDGRELSRMDCLDYYIDALEWIVSNASIISAHQAHQVSNIHGCDSGCMILVSLDPPL